MGPLFFTLLLTGVAVIIGNYADVFGDGTANWRLWYGLALVSVSFLVATQWH